MTALLIRALAAAARQSPAAVAFWSMVTVCLGLVLLYLLLRDAIIALAPVLDTYARARRRPRRRPAQASVTATRPAASVASARAPLRPRGAEERA